MENQNILIYENQNGNIKVDVRFEDRELDKDSVIRNYRITANDGKNYDVLHYNLDMIIALGFRVRSNTGTKFRIWANQKLKE